MDTAIERLARAMRLSPLDPALNHIQAVTAVAHFLAGRFEEACKWAEQPLREEPNWVPASSAAAAHALARRPERAQQATAHLRALDPELRVSTFSSRLFRRPEQLALWQKRSWDGRTAGMIAAGFGRTAEIFGRRNDAVPRSEEFR
jgi:hypothetical protein